MERCIHEGVLSQDSHKRYYVHEPGVLGNKILTCTSGCPLEVWLNHTWIAGHVEGDGEDYGPRVLTDRITVLTQSWWGCVARSKLICYTQGKEEKEGS